MVAGPQLQLQMGDRVTIVGTELAVAHAEKVLGNSMKRLNHPNLIPIFIGIALGCILGSIPFAFPGIPPTGETGTGRWSAHRLYSDQPFRTEI